MRRDMVEDKRRTHRYHVSGIAKIQCGAGALPRDCLVTDISDGGVRLHAERIEIPDEFVLLLTGRDGGRRECRVVWRLGFEIGAEFTDVPRRGFACRIAGARSG